MSGTTTYNGVSYVTQLHPYDVLFGRGSGPNDHEGNIRFRQLVAERKTEYLATNHRLTKAKIAREIVNQVLNHQGRFLKKIEDTEDLGIPPGVDCWVEVDDNTIMEKAKQALRQNTNKNTGSGNRPSDASQSSTGSVGAWSGNQPPVASRSNSSTSATTVRTGHIQQQQQQRQEQYTRTEDDLADYDDLEPIPISSTGRSSVPNSGFVQTVGPGGIVTGTTRQLPPVHHSVESLQQQYDMPPPIMTATAASGWDSNALSGGSGGMHQNNLNQGIQTNLTSLSRNHSAPANFNTGYMNNNNNSNFNAPMTNSTFTDAGGPTRAPMQRPPQPFPPMKVPSSIEYGRGNNPRGDVGESSNAQPTNPHAVNLTDSDHSGGVPPAAAAAAAAAPMPVHNNYRQSLTLQDLQSNRRGSMTVSDLYGRSRQMTDMVDSFSKTRLGPSSGNRSNLSETSVSVLNYASTETMGTIEPINAGSIADMSFATMNSSTFSFVRGNESMQDNADSVLNIGGNQGRDFQNSVGYLGGKNDASISVNDFWGTRRKSGHTLNSSGMMGAVREEPAFSSQQSIPDDDFIPDAFGDDSAPARDLHGLGEMGASSVSMLKGMLMSNNDFVLPEEDDDDGDDNDEDDDHDDSNDSDHDPRQVRNQQQFTTSRGPGGFNPYIS